MNTRKFTARFIDNLRTTHKVASADLGNFGGIFALHYPHPLAIVILSFAKYAMFPGASLASIILAVLAIKRFYLDPGRSPFYKKQTFHKAIIETLAAGAITAAVVLSFLGSAIVPIIFVSTLAVKSFYHGLAALTYFAKSFFVTIKDKNNNIDVEETQSERRRYRLMAKRNFIDFAIGAMFTVGLSFMMLAAGPVLPLVGIGMGVLNAVVALVYVVKTMPPKRREAETFQREENNISNLVIDEAKVVIHNKQTLDYPSLFRANLRAVMDGEPTRPMDSSPEIDAVKSPENNDQRLPVLNLDDKYFPQDAIAQSIPSVTIRPSNNKSENLSNNSSSDASNIESNDESATRIVRVKPQHPIYHLASIEGVGVDVLNRKLKDGTLSSPSSSASSDRSESPSRSFSESRINNSISNLKHNNLHKNSKHNKSNNQSSESENSDSESERIKREFRTENKKNGQFLL